MCGRGLQEVGVLTHTADVSEPCVDVGPLQSDRICLQTQYGTTSWLKAQPWYSSRCGM